MNYEIFEKAQAKMGSIMEDWRDVDKRERRKEYLTIFVMCVIVAVIGKYLFGMF